MHKIRKQEVHNDVYLCGSIVTISTTRALKKDCVEKTKKKTMWILFWREVSKDKCFLRLLGP